MTSVVGRAELTIAPRDRIARTVHFKFVRSRYDRGTLTITQLITNGVDMAIHIETLPKGLIGYKASGYETWNSSAYQLNADDSKDWSGLYVSLTRKLAKGYRYDYLDESTGGGTVYLHEVHLLENMNLLVCDDKKIGDGTIDANTKKKLVIQQLPQGIKVNEDGLLLPQLGQAGYLFKGFHDPDDMELIVPNRLCSKVNLIKHVTYKFKNWSKSAKIKHG